MRILIAILSCRRDRIYHQLVRDTWLKNQQVDYKFFLGIDQLGTDKLPLTEDEVLLDVSDRYSALRLKVEKMFDWIRPREYDYTFKCDTDTFVHVPRLLKSGYEQHDWIAFQCNYGGSGYWLSRKAIEMLTKIKIDHFREDGWVGTVLLQQGLKPFQDPRYHSDTNEGPSPDNDFITNHWHSDHNAIDAAGRKYERYIGSQERLALFPVHHEKAKLIP